MTTVPLEPTGPPEPEMIARVEGRLGHLTLNRPGKMNALSITLIGLVRRQLQEWATDGAVEVVLIDGAGERGFCAGGDVRQLREGIVSGTGPASFFEDEYTTNALIAHYPKPYVAVMDGVTMGGGVGLSAHGNVRVVTERSVIAMPETGIGLFPDVGALYLLARIPGGLGTHMALTGARLDGASAIAAGLADRWMPSVDIPRLIDGLAGGTAALEQVVWPEIPTAAATPAWIDECYTADRVSDVLLALDHHPDPGAAAAAATIRAVSPTAVKVTLAAIRRARDLDVDGVLAQDMMLVHRFLAEPDLAEGIRAQVVDKDRTPRWTPASLDAVDDAVVAAFFG